MTRAVKVPGRWRWAIAVVAGTGLTLLIATGFALLAPPELLDAAVALGDRTLDAALVATFLVTTGLARLLLIRRRDPAERVEQTPPPSVKPGQSHLR